MSKASGSREPERTREVTSSFFIPQRKAVATATRSARGKNHLVAKFMDSQGLELFNDNTVACVRSAYYSPW